MNDRVPFRKDDQQAVMQEVGPFLPVILREAADEGFYQYAKSRERDPVGFVVYDKGCRAKMLYCHISAAARHLFDGAQGIIPDLRYREADNECATEFMSGPYLVYRLKRIKRNRRNLTTSYLTDRQRKIRSPYCQSVGQLSLPIPNNIDFLPLENRCWVTLSWDLDELEESMNRVVLGAETRKHWMWLQPLSAGEPDVIERLPAPIAERIQELRHKRAS